MLGYRQVSRGGGVVRMGGLRVVEGGRKKEADTQSFEEERVSGRGAVW